MYLMYPLLLFCMFCLSGCSQVPGGAQLMALIGPKKPLMTQESISKLPYAAISAKVGDGPEAMMILGRMDGADHHYFAQDKAIIILRNGRIVRTYGLPHNLWYMGLSSDIFEKGLNTLKAAATETRYIDLNRDGLQNIEIQATFTHEGTEKLTIYGREYSLLRLCETVNAPQLKWCYQNHYWVFEYNGLVMKSIQHIHPKLSPLQVTVLRPAV